MNTEIINPEEFGLTTEKAQPIEQAFAPSIVERDAFIPIYKELITKELTPELVVEAKELRKKLVKVRTGIASVHKTQKDFALNYGRFVDSWKNKETLPVVQMETKLKEIEDHFANIERERLVQLQVDRAAELAKHDPAYVPDTLASMDDEVWTNYLSGVKLANDTKIENERKAAEDAAAAAKAAKEAAEKERIEREKAAEKERVEREKAAEAERKEAADKAAKIEAENKRLKQEHEEQRKQAELKEAKAAKERAAHEAEMKAEREERQREELNAEAKRQELERQIKAKADAEAKVIADEAQRVQSELNKGDAAKVADLLAELNMIKSKYSFKSKKNRKMYEDVGLLIDKVTGHITK
jgi:hypothetical protein